MLESLDIPVRGIGFHRLNMVAVIMPPTPHLAVHVIDLTVMGLDKLLLIGSYPFIDLFGKYSHFSPQLDYRAVDSFICAPRKGYA